MEKELRQKIQKQSKGKSRIFLGLLFVAIVSGLFSALTTAFLNGTLFPFFSFSTSNTNRPNIASIAGTTSAGTVSISGVSNGEKIVGSGFVVSQNGKIVTCAHVVSDEHATYTATGANQKTHPVKIIYEDTSHDLAVLQVTDGSRMTPLPLGNSNTVYNGDQVIAVGDPFGLLSGTVSRGIVSGTHRDILAQNPDNEEAEELSGLIQIDAPLNPGESGGPVVNAMGQVVGISAASDTRAQNISFAIPVNDVKRILFLMNMESDIS